MSLIPQCKSYHVTYWLYSKHGSAVHFVPADSFSGKLPILNDRRIDDASQCGKLSQVKDEQMVRSDFYPRYTICFRRNCLTVVSLQGIVIYKNMSSK